MELPRALEGAHLLFSFDDFDKNHRRYTGEEINWWFSEQGFYQIRIFESHQHSCTRVPGTEDHLVLTWSWGRGVDTSHGYPRYHLFPSSARIVTIDGELILGVWLSGHIDKEEHWTDRTLAAYEQVHRLIEELKQKSYADFYGR